MALINRQADKFDTTILSAASSERLSALIQEWKVKNSKALVLSMECQVENGGPMTIWVCTIQSVSYCTDDLAASDNGC